MAPSPGAPVGAGWGVQGVQGWELGDSVYCQVWLWDFRLAAGPSGSQPEGRAMAFPACSGIVLGTPCHMVKHMSSAATLPRFEPWLSTSQLGECNSVPRQMASGTGHLF